MVETRRLTTLAEGPRSIIARAAPGPIVVALSGGADSAAAAWLAAESGRAIGAIHVHHGSPASDTLQDAARQIADRLDLTLTIAAEQVPAGPSYEAQARLVRRRVLDQHAEPGSWIVTGHTRDDQVETVLMRLLRGTGIDGLAGMAPDRPPHLRPLLASTRSVAREIASLVGLPWRDDPSNRDRRHVRNRIRIDLLPELEAAFGPGVAQSLAGSADAIRRDVELLNALARDVGRREEHGRILLSLEDLARVGRGVASRAVRRAIRDLDPPYAPALRVVDTVLAVAAGDVRRVDIGRLSAHRFEGWLSLEIHDVPNSRTGAGAGSS